ncbi:MAG: hypothetical protein OEV31_06485 [Gammaproteobacteria bacterium]|nr:hypothetical protein [Gammaproteobacteria bacterium]
MSARGSETLRRRITQEAARIMAEEGVRDFHAAKRKAAGRLNQSENRHLPSNSEVEAALAEYLNLFHARDLPHTRQRLLGVALNTLQLLVRFEPRLVGPLLQGVATPYSEVQIQAFADNPVEVAVCLQDHNIPYEEYDRRLRYGGERVETAPVFRFLAGDTSVAIDVLPLRALREAPLSPVDARPMKRAAIRDVEILLAGLSPSPANPDS